MTASTTTCSKLAQAKRRYVPELKIAADEMVAALEAEQDASRSEKGAS